MWSPCAWVSAIRTIGAPSSRAAATIAFALSGSAVSTSGEAVVLADEVGVDEAEAADPGHWHGAL